MLNYRWNVWGRFRRLVEGGGEVGGEVDLRYFENWEEISSAGNKTNISNVSVFGNDYRE